MMLAGNHEIAKFLLFSISAVFFPPHLLPTCLRAVVEAELAAVPAWWAEKHEAAAAERVAGAAPPGWVFPPDAFDVTVAPGEDVQAAVDRCPPGGSVLLLPGAHDGPLFLDSSKEVHVFGRGQATLRGITASALTSHSTDATVDGLILRQEVMNGDRDDDDFDFFGDRLAEFPCVSIAAGGLRLQACDVTGAAAVCVSISGGADPRIASCRSV